MKLCQRIKRGILAKPDLPTSGRKDRRAYRRLKYLSVDAVRWDR